MEADYPSATQPLTARRLYAEHTLLLCTHSTYIPDTEPSNHTSFVDEKVGEMSIIWLLVGCIESTVNNLTSWETDHGLHSH